MVDKVTWGDCDPPATVYTVAEKRVVCRKPHLCDCCTGEIRAGDTALYFKLMIVSDEVVFDRQYWHEQCGEQVEEETRIRRDCL